MGLESSPQAGQMQPYLERRLGLRFRKESDATRSYVSHQGGREFWTTWDMTGRYRKLVDVKEIVGGIRGDVYRLVQKGDFGGALRILKGELNGAPDYMKAVTREQISVLIKFKKTPGLQVVEVHGKRADPSVVTYRYVVRDLPAPEKKWMLATFPSALPYRVLER